MDIKISKKLKYTIFIGVLMLLMSIVYIYTSKTYLMGHSMNLQTGGGTENCQRAMGLLPFMGLYLCEPGYYQVAYPTHKKIFYYRYSSSSGLGPSTYTVFLEGADIKTFNVLNKYYAIDKDNLYFVDFGDFIEMIKTSHTNLSSVSVFNDAGKYATDNDSVFFRGEKIYGVTPSDFKFFDGGQSVYGFRFALSDGKIFNGNKLVSAVRDGKFLVNTEGEELPFPCNNKRTVSPGRGYHYYSPEGASKLYQYLHQCDITESGEDEQIDIDTKSFKVINNSLYPYVKDKNYVYTCSAFDCSELHVLEGANPNTFNFGEVTRFEDYPPRDPHFYQNELMIERNRYILGCKVYEGFESDLVKKVERGDTDDNSDLCEYFIYSTTE